MSLSKDIFAYVFISKQLKLELETGESLEKLKGIIKDDESPIPNFTRDDPWKNNPHLISGIVKHGDVRLKIPTGGEVYAATEAGYEVAKWFKVVPKLPCMIAFDVVPGREPVTLSLTSATSTALVPLFRNVVGRLTENPKFRELIDAIRTVHTLRTEITRTEALLHPPDEKRIRAHAREVLERSRDLRLFLASGPSLSELDHFTRRDPLDSEQRGRIRTILPQLRKLVTARRLLQQKAESLGTEHEIVEKPKRFFRRTIAPLLPAEVASSVPASVSEWAAVDSVLADIIAQLLDQLVSDVPDEIALESQIEARVKDEVQNYQVRIEQISDDLPPKIAHLDSTLAALKANISVSFSQILAEEARKLQLEITNERLLNNVVTWLNWLARPKNLERLGRLFGSMITSS